MSDTLRNRIEWLINDALLQAKKKDADLGYKIDVLSIAIKWYAAKNPPQRGRVIQTTEQVVSQIGSRLDKYQSLLEGDKFYGSKSRTSNGKDHPDADDDEDEPAFN